ncbi:ferritin [Halalkalibacterium halodurans]|uniref:Ferritin n=2 Tax=Halalkalibacterium halodurans TaxID=86665 RepID=Q9KDT7_HALH5|nr:ferritin [Halalkalibacterium halodurans]MDY7221656.1 ferritin [Halalkalibacterium halodurans]MDY7240932.1 ferritin [Halalkalibacterium halodurans]MED3645503.1 ferritin [Halalkalibacterium halodurans]MED4079327.1 ferritin [Halalkalibacterium halodurans]MED4085398.1 ferritin [Halalkalibacterium halodurans]
MLNEKLLQALNKQMNYEMYAAHSYLAMAAYCSAESLDGFANFFMVQAEEERFHGMKFYNFINAMGERARFEGFESPNNEFSSVLDCFEKSLEQEKLVTKQIYDLSDLAWDAREHATINFLKWFIDEQVEEEDMFDTIIQKLKRIDNDSNAFFMMDNEFSKRSFNPEDEA